MMTRDDIAFLRNAKTINWTIADDDYHGYHILRCELRRYDWLTGEFIGRSRIYYDVEDDEITIDTFKTLKEAKSFIEKLL